jgi:hypothetical protein
MHLSTHQVLIKFRQDLSLFDAISYFHIHFGQGSSDLKFEVDLLCDFNSGACCSRLTRLSRRRA